MVHLNENDPVMIDEGFVDESNWDFLAKLPAPPVTMRQHVWFPVKARGRGVSVKVARDALVLIGGDAEASSPRLVLKNYDAIEAVAMRFAEATLPSDDGYFLTAEDVRALRAR